MNKEIVKKLINLWDPLGVYGLGPNDEYDDEVTAILALFATDKVDEEKVKSYLLNLYYSDIAKNEERVNELYDLLLYFSKLKDKNE